MSVDDFRRNVLESNADLNVESVDILINLIQLQTVNRGCDLCKIEPKEKVKRFDGKII